MLRASHFDLGMEEGATLHLDWEVGLPVDRRG